MCERERVGLNFISLIIMQMHYLSNDETHLHW
jgi:hypothetical protein